MYAQYCRIEARAGGVSCTRRAFIREALRMIRKRSRYSRAFRTMRHEWIRHGLQYHGESIEEYYNVVTGNFRPTRTATDAQVRRTMYYNSGV